MLVRGQCYRKKNILELQRHLILSDFGKSLARLGVIAEEFPIDKLQEDIQAFKQCQTVCRNAKGWVVRGSHKQI